MSRRIPNNVYIVPDDAKVIRHGQLKELYELAGGLRPLAEALGVGVPTLSRHIRAINNGSPDAATGVDAARERLREITATDGA